PPPLHPRNTRAPMESKPNTFHRRKFLGASMGLAAAAGAASCSSKATTAPDTSSSTSENALPENLSADDFLNHGQNPWTLETRREELQGAITPTDKIFVRGNLPFPDASIVDKADAWSVSIEGVKSPRSMTVADLKSLGSRTIAAVLQCSGNGRKFFEHGPSGSPWGVGAAANVLWTGIPLKTVIDELGGVDGGGKQFITGTGGEAIPAGLPERDVVVERSIPIEKAMADAMLCWDLNSEPIPLSHGGPLRLVVPGYYGINNVKYLTKLVAADSESDAKIQAKSYRVRPIGESGAPTQPSMYAMNVKSWITGPLGASTAKAGRHIVKCVAFCGEATVASVEISMDGGATWTTAQPTSDLDLGPFAWREYMAAWDAKPGQHTLMSRATDSNGNVQPELRLENERGYAHNGWRDHGVTVTIA
ncbi:MAG: sulfite oxidase, partial [Planctomycetota bacterium]